jgi:antitoxin MazE
MRINLIPVGTSKGIRLPKTVLEQCRVQDAFDLEIDDGAIILRPIAEPRRGWDKAFREMAENGDDILLDPETPTLFDREEWQW